MNVRSSDRPARTQYGGSPRCAPDPLLGVATALAVANPSEVATNERERCQSIGVAISVVDSSEEWPLQFEGVAADLRLALAEVRVRSIEHVGATSVPGLAAKPIIDIDVIVDSQDVPAAVAALEAVGYQHRGDLGLSGREVFLAPDDAPARHVYVCEVDSIHVRNHLAVRQVLRQRADLRDRYAAVKRQLTADDDIAIDEYVAGKSAILQEILELAELTESERAQILRLNNSV